MSISNLHSLLNKPWYIEEQYAMAHLPLLFNMLDGKPFEKSKEDIIAFTSNKTSSSNKNASASNSVAILNIKNPIVKHDQMCGPKGTKSMMRELDVIKNNDSIAGVVLDIDSGGGQAYGTAEFHDYLKSYPKPVVAYTDGLMCSAAYYIGSAASEIIANKRAEAIGSIGAYTQILDLAGYYEKQGAKLHTIYASQSTEKNKAYRDALNGDYKTYIQQELDPLVSTFISDMNNARPGIKETAFKGAVYNAEIALKNGLIDQIGTLQDAIDKVIELSDKNKTTKTTSTMNKKFTKVQAVLGMETEFESNDQGVYLNEDQLGTLNTTLEENETAIANAETASETAVNEATAPLNQTIETLQNSNTVLTTAIDTALATAEIERAELTNEQAVEALANLVVEYGKNDGAQHTRTKDNADNQDLGETSNVGGIDISEAMNN